MSNIFEALQRAEAERSGGDVPKAADTVADLLRGVEKEIERERSFSELPSAGLAAELPPVEKPPSAASEAFVPTKVIVPSVTADSRLVCLTDQGGLAAEKFRVLGLKLRYLREQRKLKRIVITSSIPEEGKSLVSSNLALNQSRSKVLKTVLIDGDLRRPELARRFGFHRSLAGLSEVLRGERRLSDVVYKIEGSGLWFMPAGVTPENPLDLMQSARMQQLLEQLETFFDWIIIDTPPIRPLADTPLWMKLADGMLLVTREGVCDKKQLERAVEVVDRSLMLGLVVNSCSSNEHKYYYSRYDPAANAEESSAPAAKN